MGIASAVFEVSLAQATALPFEQERLDRARQLQEFEEILDSVEAQNLQTQRGVPESVMSASSRWGAACLCPHPGQCYAPGRGRCFTPPWLHGKAPSSTRCDRTASATATASTDRGSPA